MYQLKDSRTSGSVLQKSRKILWLRLHITNLCNFDCPDCHVSKISPNNLPFDNMPFEIAESSIEYYISLIKRYLPIDNWQTRVSVYGGEPLLNRPVLYRLLKKFGKVYRGVRLHWIVNTNGSLINEEDLKNFILAEVDIHLSLEGNKESHDKKRIDKFGRGTFHRIVKSIDLCKKFGYPYLQIDSVADPFIPKITDEVFDIVKKYKIGRVHLDLFYSPAYPKEFPFEEYALDYSEAYIKGKLNNVNVFASPFSQIYAKYFDDIVQKQTFFYFPSIEIFGDGSFIFPDLPLEKPFDNIINIEKNSIWDRRMELLSKDKQNNDKECKNCFLYPFCIGKMRRIYEYHTATSSKEDNICKISRKSMKLLKEKNYSNSAY